MSRRAHRASDWGPNNTGSDLIEDFQASYPTFSALPDSAYGNYRVVRRPATYPKRIYFRRYYAPTRHANVPEDFVSKLRMGDMGAWIFHNAERQRLLKNFIGEKLGRVDRPVSPKEWVKAYAERARLPVPIAADDILRHIQGQPIRRQYFPGGVIAAQERFAADGTEYSRDDPEWIDQLDRLRFGLGHHSFNWNDRQRVVEDDMGRIIAEPDQWDAVTKSQLLVDHDMDPTEVE